MTEYSDSFGGRLKKFISFKTLSINGFSKVLGYEAPQKMYRLFNDDSNNPSFQIIQDISNKFQDLNLVWLVTGKGEMLINDIKTSHQTDMNLPQSPAIDAKKSSSKQKMGVVQQPFMGDFMGKSMVNSPLKNYKPNKNDTGIVQEPMPFYGSKTPQIITLDSHGRDNIIFVPVKAQAGYLLGYGDKEYIETLPSFSMPGITNGTYRMFEVNGISMAPTLGSGDKVIAEWIQNPLEMRDNRVYIVVHKEGVAIKRVINRLQQRGKLYLASDTIHHRSEFPTKEINPEDIMEIWYVRLKISGDLSEPSEIFKKMADFDINLTQVMTKLGIPKL